MDKVEEYFGDGDKMHMLFNFTLNQYLFLALARKEAGPLMEGMMKPPTIPERCQWANFLRNHDEIDLGRLSDSQRADVFREFGPQKNMQLYDRGIRRRLAPMLGRRYRAAEDDVQPAAVSAWYTRDSLRRRDWHGRDLSLKERDSIRTPCNGRPN